MGKLTVVGFFFTACLLLMAGCTTTEHRHFVTDYNGVMVEAIEAGNGAVLYKVFETTGTL